MLSSFGITGICVGAAIALGACWGAVLIYRGRSRPRFEPEVTLGLEAEAR